MHNTPKILLIEIQIVFFFNRNRKNNLLTVIFSYITDFQKHKGINEGWQLFHL